MRRLRDPARAATSIAEALVDQRALAGIGNVYKSEVLWIERVSPFSPVAAVEDEALRRLVDTARRLLLVNADDDAWPGARDHRRRPRRTRTAVRLRPDGTAVPPLPDADRAGDPGPRPAPLDLLVPGLPAEPRLTARVSSRPMCEHFIARAAEPFRLDELWPFAERLERYGLAGFGWGAAWVGADGAARGPTATSGRSAMTPAARRSGAR